MTKALFTALLQTSVMGKLGVVFYTSLSLIDYISIARDLKYKIFKISNVRKSVFVIVGHFHRLGQTH